MKMKIGTEGKKFAVGILVFAAGMMLVTTGIRNGEQKVVLEKAINICMECIGIG